MERPKTGILDLPNELLYQIFDELSTSTTHELKNLRFTCSQLNNVLEPLLFSEITLDASHPRMLADLALKRTRVGGHVKFLHISSLDLDLATLEKESTDTEPIIHAFSRHLVPALRSFKSLVSINWTVTESDSHWAIEQVITHLSPLPTLSILNLYLKGIWNHPIPLPFRRICHFKYLRSCAVRVDDNRLLLLIAEGLFDANRLHIESLELDGGFDSFTDPERDMTNDTELSLLFNSKLNLCELDCIPQTAPRLKELSLSQFPLRDSPSMLSQLGSLKALHLDRCIPYDFWKMAAQMGIELQEITVDHVDEKFLEYLESYQGLERVRVAFNGIQIGGSALNDSNAERFWMECLPRHRLTMRSIGVHPKAKGKWCFSGENAKVFRMCEGVEQLTVGIDVDGTTMVGEEESEEEKDDITLLLEVANSYKKLKNLTVLLKGHGLPWDFIKCEQACSKFNEAIIEHGKSSGRSSYEISVTTRSEQNRRRSKAVDRFGRRNSVKKG
ncbi:hypothetical protein L218DRAFT_963273 [Marasmius fiardii PR-910]|nr:hypothetical protein L218DRAFT_963273 [Marasmius fiardii PR-910]